MRAAFFTDSAHLVVRSQPMMISFAGGDRPALGAAVDLTVDGEMVDSIWAPGGLDGSSISQCGEAHSPLRTWPAVAARLGGWNLTSLGFSGSCHLDQFVARHIRDLPADRISVKAGINIVGGASMTQRTFAPRFTDFSTPCATATPTRRSSWHRRSGVRSSKRNPDPAGSGAAVSSPSTATRPTSPSERSLSWIRDYVRDAVARRAERGDANLHYVDGLDLFSLADAADLPDDLHPNGDGYERIGQRWHALAG